MEANGSIWMPPSEVFIDDVNVLRQRHCRYPGRSFQGNQLWGPNPEGGLGGVVSNPREEVHLPRSTGRTHVAFDLQDLPNTEGPSESVKHLLTPVAAAVMLFLVTLK